MSDNEDLTDTEFLAKFVDTELFDVPDLHDGPLPEAIALRSDARLVIRRHDIHRTDKLADGGEEQITSTLKFFQVEVALVDGDNLPILELDGHKVRAILLYENGKPAEEVSVSQEPPLLGGEAVLEEGVATLRMRITILSSLCNFKRFRVHISLAESPHVCATTTAVKTLTKLRRTSKGGAKAAAAAAEEDITDAPEAPEAPSISPPSAAGAQRPAPKTKRAVSESAEKGPPPKGAPKESVLCSNTSPACHVKPAASCADPATEKLEVRSLKSLWDEVEQNGAKLRELQAQQRLLFAELRRMREKPLAAAAADRTAEVAANKVTFSGGAAPLPLGLGV